MLISNSNHLDFGCGENPRNPFNLLNVYSCDIYQSNAKHHSVMEPGNSIPFEDGFFDSVSAYDVLEHLSREGNPSDFVFYMNEMYRVLKPGGQALFVFPLYNRKGFFDDPTHINPTTLALFNFFSGPGLNPYTGITTQYEIVKQVKLINWDRWVYEPEVNKTASQASLSVRRRASLTKRSIMRILRPSHGLFIGKKPKED